MTMIYLVVLVMVSTVKAGDCPVSCLCAEIPSYELPPGDELYTSVVCGGGESDNVTQYLPKNTRKLRITDAQMNVGDFFEELYDLPNVAHLEFSDCDFLNATSISFGADRLRTLRITRCQTDLTLVNVTGLKILDLSGNKFEVIDCRPFRTLSRLEVLNLSANAIDALQPDIFEGMSCLKCLDLSGNNLTVLKDTVLVPVINLQHLNLSNNRLEVLNEACFSSLLHLQQLDVSWNRLARVVPGSLELPSLARLLLAGNPGLGHSRKPTLLVGTGRRLQTVDASRTGLRQVPAALTHSIRTLRLAGNSIRFVNCGDLDSYPLLQLLDFMSNDLENVEDDALGRLDSLSILYLTDNKLRAIPRSLPEKLKVLHLEGNDIRQIQLLDLEGMQQIEVLLLNDNKISIVEASAFGQLGTLTTLDLSKNPITVLPAGALSGPIHLQVLRLADLGVVSPVKEVAFPLTAPEHLITLDLSRSPGLAHQLLVDTAALAAARELQELNLSDTGLENIRSDLLHFLPQLRVLHLRGNSINCTDLQWLAFWMRTQDEPEYRSVTCASPPELWGTPLVDLQNTEFEVPQKLNGTEIQFNREPNKNETIPKMPNSSLFGEVVTKRSDIALKTTKEKGEILTNATYAQVNKQENLHESFSFKEKHDNNSSTPDDMQNITLSSETNLTIPTAQMSVYGGENKVGFVVHPGMLILIIGILAATAVLAMLMTRFAKRRRRSTRRLSDIEVSSIPGVTELW